MDGWGRWAGSPAEDFPRGLRGDAVTVRPRWGWLALLLLACLIPRVWEASRWSVLWPDTIDYLAASEALDRGDRRAAFAELNLNTYPVILHLLRRGFSSWQGAAEAWSVVMATLTVLPLFGWIRRQFNDHVALVACLLYAFHPKLVALTPLIIRDPTFWFLLSLTLYLSWRAVTEARWWLFLTAGAALTLAIHTRSEGWLLLVPIVLWSGYRLWVVPDRRMRLAFGTLACIAVIPASVAAVNLTWLRDCPRWGLVRTAHLEMAESWLRTQQDPQDAAPAPNSGPPEPSATPVVSAAVMAPAIEPAPSRIVMARKFGLRFVKIFGYSFGLVALLGIWGRRRIYIRLEHQAVLLMALLLVAALWVRYSQGEIDIRYFVPVVLAAFPWMALGLLWLGEWFVWLTRWGMSWSRWQRTALAAICMLATVLLGLPEKKLAAAPAFNEQAAVGRWILSQLGPGQRVAGSRNDLRLVSYYAHSEVIPYNDPRELSGEPLVPVMALLRPDVVLLWRSSDGSDGWASYAEIFRRQSELGYHRVPAERAPAGCDDVAILVRHDKLR